MFTRIAIFLFSLTPFALSGHQHDLAPGNSDKVHYSIDTDKTPYHVVSSWGNNPEIGPTHGGVVVGKAGAIYVSSSRGIFVFNASGELMRSIENPAVSDIHGMTLVEENGTEYIYGARNKSAELIKLKTNGEVVLTVPFPAESGIEGKYMPTAVVVKPNGNILVADGYGTNYIYEFNSEGKYLSHFGGKNMEAKDKFKTPHGLTIDTRYEPARLLVSDREKRRLVHFSLDGEYIAEVITGLRRPCAVSIHKGFVAVAELEGRVAILNRDNELVGVLGDNPDKDQRANFKVAPKDWKEGIFTAPHGLSWDHSGNLYVQDWNQTGRISKWEHLK